MFNAFKKRFQAHKTNADFASYMIGYRYAAGELLMHGVHVAADLEARAYGSSDPFDKGIEAAVRDYDRLLESSLGQ